jgi:hypothetical protein
MTPDDIHRVLEGAKSLHPAYGGGAPATEEVGPSEQDHDIAATNHAGPIDMMEEGADEGPEVASKELQQFISAHSAAAPS